MKNITAILLCILLLSSLCSNKLYSQEHKLTPLNNTANTSLIQSESSKMSWLDLQDSIKTKMGEVITEIVKEEKKIYLITTVVLKNSPSKWIDSTIVTTHNFSPVYHASYNPQREMVLKFGEHITGYYLNKKTNARTKISNTVAKPFFDSNFYPQLIRFLPLQENYTTNISIYDYKPMGKIGVITATIKNTEETNIHFKGKNRRVWKIKTTDDISDNAVISIYYIEMSTRKILRQEINAGERKMIMELM